MNKDVDWEVFEIIRRLDKPENTITVSKCGDPNLEIIRVILTEEGEHCKIFHAGWLVYAMDNQSVTLVMPQLRGHGFISNVDGSVLLSHWSRAVLGNLFDSFGLEINYLDMVLDDRDKATCLESERELVHGWHAHYMLYQVTVK